jgi:hypothetical protein
MSAVSLSISKKTAGPETTVVAHSASAVSAALSTGLVAVLRAQRYKTKHRARAGQLILPSHFMRAYYFDNLPGDQRLQHDSGTSVDLADLRKLGLLHWAIPLDSPGGWESEIDRIAEQQSYKNRDTIDVTKEGLGDQYESKIKIFFQELVWRC